MPVQNLERLWRVLLVALEIHASRFEEKHPPLVVVGDVRLVRRDALERRKVVVSLKNRFKFGLNGWKIVFQLFCYRERIGVEELLVPQQTMLVERLLQKPLNPQSAYL